MLVCLLGKLSRSLGVLAVAMLALGLGRPLARAQSNDGYGALFTEEVLTVDRERDGILPGTLRSALIQANGIRAQNSFALVKIVFDPKVSRVRITKGPLPELDSSLTTLDCSRPQGRVLLEYVPPEDNSGEDPGYEPSVLTLSSNGNMVRGCRITGAVGPGIYISGNRNVLEYNTIGFHKDIPETVVPPSALYPEPKTNGRSGISLGKGANENLIQHNDIVGNPYHGVILEDGVGTGNKIIYNFFAKNSGIPIKASATSPSAQVPSIQSITQTGDTFHIQGTADPRADIQIYMLGQNLDQIEMLVAEGQGHPKNNSATFSIETKSKGFVLGETKLVALAYVPNLNSSEFSRPILLGLPAEPPTPEADNPNGENPGERVEGLPDEGAEANPDHPASPETSSQESPDEPEMGGGEGEKAQGGETGRNIGSRDEEMVIDLNGKGDGGGDPDSGRERQNNVAGSGF